MPFDRPNKRRPSGDSAAAFTLIELLVVVSIIALLISILMPSLKSAREQAKVVVCMANQGNLGRSNSIYHGQNNDWLVGGPGTSGSAVLRHPERSNWDDGSEYIHAKVLQIWDWITPLAMFDSIPARRPDYYKLLFERYRCPNNRYLARPTFGGASSGWPATQAPSYYTIRQMLVWPNGSNSAPYGEAMAGGALVGGEGDAWHLPASYSPRIERLGNPAEKVFLTDGSRWTDPINGAWNYSVPWNTRAGGAFSTGGPTMAYTYMRNFFFSNGQTRSIAPITYRHQKSSKVGIAVTFYDGHSAYLSEDRSRHPDPWWPSGTLLTPAELNNPARSLVGPYMRPWPLPGQSSDVVAYRVR